MNILYINHYAGSIYHGMEYRPYYLAREWVKMGHSVTIVACNYSHVRQKNITIPKGQAYLEEIIDGIKYIWVPAPKYKVNGIWRFINIFIFLKNIKKIHNKLVNAVKPDMVIASSTYPFDTKIAYKIAKLAKARFIYEVHDLWPLSPIEVGGMSKHHPFIWLTQMAEDFAYCNADKVVSLLPKAAEYMQEHGMKPENFVYIPNGIKIDNDQSNAPANTKVDFFLQNPLFNKITKDSENEKSNVQLIHEYKQRQNENDDDLPVAHQQIIDTARMQYQFLIGYAGGMAGGNSLRCAIDAILNINTHNATHNLKDKIAFIMLGDGVNKTRLQEYVAQHNLVNVVFLDAVPKTVVRSFLNQMDALFVGFPKLSLYRFGVSPNKVFDYMFAKKPIIYAITAGNDLVQDANCGISVEADNSVTIAQAFTQLSIMPKDDLNQMGLNGYNYVLQNHDYRVLAQRFIQECE